MNAGLSRSGFGALFAKWCVALLLVVCGAQAFAQAGARNFDHTKTGFALTGVHMNPRCESCHISGVFKGTPKDCASCHTSGFRQARGNMVMPAKHLPTTAACETCHNTRSFKEVKFSHVDVKPGTCATCHNGTTAIGKHAAHMPTQAACDTCHKSTSTWKSAKPDHSAFTATTNCASCHGSTATGKSANHIPVAASVSCLSCHTVTGWKPTKFNHTQVAVAGQCATCHSGAFPPADGRTANHIPYQSVNGVANAGCESCHKAGYTAWAPATFHGSFSVTGQCATCHTGNNPKAVGKHPTHVPTAAACETCHKTTGWKGAKPDHASFTAATNCATCHNGTNATGKTAVHIPVAANVNCFSCHSVAGWKPTKFNHTQVAVAGQCATCHSGAFPPADGKTANHIVYQNITGIGANASCESCHKAGYTAWAPAKFHASYTVTAQCATCHTGANPLAVGKPANHLPTTAACETCHKTTGWIGAKVDHSGFTTATNCTTCHNGTTATGKPVVHPVTTANCITCHTTVAWTGAKVDHTSFTAATNCASCHNGATATGKPVVHVPTTANCFSCHTVAGWKPTKFNHTQVTVTGQCSTCHSGAFPPADGRPTNHIPYQTLSGVAITNCDSCHKGGYAAWAPARFHSSVSVSNQCASCHTGNFPPAVGKPNTPIHAGVTNCESCHKTTGWAGAKVDHSTFTMATNCSSCHNGTTATGKRGNHIPTAVNCFSCHSTTGWIPTKFNHSQVVTANQCSTCHSGAFPPADGRPISHIPYQLLSGVAVTNCDTCHKGGFAAWTPARFHGSVSVSNQCHTCHMGTYSPGQRRPNNVTHSAITSGCESCHKSTASWLTVVFTHSPANAVGTGTCDTCHNGTSAKGKPATHIPVPAGVAKCDSCHRSQTSFATAVTMNHSVVTTATCKSCHNGSYTSQGTTGALAKPVNHIPEAQLLNGANMDCKACHTSTTSWGTMRMDHNASQGGGAGWCKSCHASGTNFLGNMDKKSLTHRTKTPAAIDCSEAGCHRPLGSRGTPYSRWN